MVAKSKPQREARIKKLLENGQDRAWQKEQREVFLDAIASVRDALSSDKTPPGEYLKGDRRGNDHVHYMLRFAQDNRHEVKLLNERNTRERVEPFLTGETFYEIFDMTYEVQSQLELFLGLVFTSLILGVQVDKALPIAYFSIFVILAPIQWLLYKRAARAYLQNQRMSSRVTAQGYTAWDNVLSGNRYNLRLWFSDFKLRLLDCLQAEIKAIAWRESLSSGGGIIGLIAARNFARS
jgi:hypothetical protein